MASKQTYPLKLLMGIPAYRGQVHYGHLFQMMSLTSNVFLSKGLLSLRALLCPESCSVDWSRNSILHAGLKDGSDWVLMCDADTFHGNTAEVIRMIEDARLRDAAVVAAPVKIRGRNAYNVLHASPDNSPVSPAEWRDKVSEIDRVGTAFMAINLHWVRDMWPDQPWFVTQHLPGPSPTKIGEDISFCDGVRERGGKILLDGRFEPVHIGASPAGAE